MFDPICDGRRLTALLVPSIAVAVFSVCGGSDEAARPSAVERPAAEAGAVQLVGIEWRLASISGADGEVVTPLPDAIPTLTFMTATTPTTDSFFRGFSGCNSFGGSYHAGDGGTLSIAPGSAMTRMACTDEIMHRENLLMAALEGATTYRIVGDGLSISFGGGTLHFEAGA